MLDVAPTDELKNGQDLYKDLQKAAKHT